MKDNNVSFRNHEGKDVCEIKYPDGNVGVFPADEVIPGAAIEQTYADRYREPFEAYKRGEAQPGMNVAGGETGETTRKRKTRKRKAAKAPAKKAAAKKPAAKKAKAKKRAKK